MNAKNQDVQQHDSYSTRGGYKHSNNLPIPTVILIAVVVAVVAGGAGFTGGMQVKKGSSTSSVAAQDSNAQGGRFGGGRGGFAGGSFGTVTAVSDTSITIQPTSGPGRASDSKTDATKTYTINSSTAVTIDGSTGSASDIKTGDTVIIRVSSSDATVATSIREGMGGFGGQDTGGTQQSDPTSGSTDDSDSDGTQTN